MAQGKATPSGKKGDLEIVVLHSRCIGAAVCVYEARGSFKLNPEKKALVTDLEANTEEVLMNAARNCPTQAIYIYRNKKQVWPPPGKSGLNKQPSTKLKMRFE